MYNITTLTAASAIVAMLGLAAPAMAECHNGKSDTQAGKANEEIVAEAKTDPETGEKEAATGDAEPTENWFGCKPESEGYEECISRKGREQEEKAGQSAPMSGDRSAMKSGSGGGDDAGTSDKPGLTPETPGSDRMADAGKEDCAEDKKKEG